MSWIDDEAAAELARQHDDRIREALRKMVKNITPAPGTRYILHADSLGEFRQDPKQKDSLKQLSNILR